MALLTLGVSLAKIRVTSVKEFDIDHNNYKGVWWPSDADEERDLTDNKEILAYEEEMYLSGEFDFEDIDAPENLKFELIEE